MKKKTVQREDQFTTAMKDPEVRAHFEREWFVDEILSALESKMRELNISRSQLARRLKCSPPNVTKLLRRGTNLTVGTVIDLALALDHRFLAPELEPLSHEPPWLSGCTLVLPRSHAWISAVANKAAEVAEAGVPASPSIAWP